MPGKTTVSARYGFDTDIAILSQLLNISKSKQINTILELKRIYATPHQENKINVALIFCLVTV